MISFVHGEEYVAWRLRVDMGLNTSKISEGSDKTCDFRASDEKDVYWVEVKERTGDERIVRAFRGEDVSLTQKTVGYDVRTATILRSAVKQLDALAPRDGSDLTIVWLEIHSPLESDLHAEQAIATLFGTADILDAGQAQLKPCYFFEESLFFRCKQLDGVVVDQPRGFLLCVNPYAPRRERFRDSRFFEFFRTRAILDAAEEESAGRAYTAFGCALDRKDEPAMLEFVRKKYSLKAPRVVRLEDSLAASAYVDAIEGRRQRRDRKQS